MDLAVNEIDDRRRARSVVTRQRIVAAALQCYETIGVDNTTMETVAQQAGVGRATLYRHFANQNEILSEIIMVELEDLRIKVLQNSNVKQSLDAFVLEACFIILIESPKKTITSYLFSESGSPVVSRLALSNDVLIGFGRELMVPIFDKATQEGRIREGVTLEHLIEWVTRFLISYLANPSQQFKTKKQKRKLIRNALLPMLFKGC